MQEGDRNEGEDGENMSNVEAAALGGERGWKGGKDYEMQEGKKESWREEG